MLNSDTDNTLFMGQESFRSDTEQKLKDTWIAAYAAVTEGDDERALSIILDNINECLSESVEL